MEKITLKIDGMMCGMCEAHINDAVRKIPGVKKAVSSRKKGTTEIIADAPIERDVLSSAIAATGYTLVSVTSEPYEKRGFSLFKK